MANHVGYALLTLALVSLSCGSGGTEASIHASDDASAQPPPPRADVEIDLPNSEATDTPDAGADLDEDGFAEGSAPGDAVSEISDDAATDGGDGRLGDGSPCPCVCTPAGCPFACASFAIDPKNCGSPGHDCQGAVCSEGQCYPTIVQEGFANLYSIVADETRLYFTERCCWLSQPYGGVLRSAYVNLDGGGFLLYGMAQWALSVIVNSTDVFLTRTGSGWFSIDKTSKSGDHFTWSPVVLIRGHGGAAALAIDATHIYWTVTGDPATLFWDKVMRSPLEPIDGGVPEVVAIEQKTPWGLAIDSNHVYWTSRGQGSIHKVPVSGGPPETLASGQGDPLNLAVDVTYLYWTDVARGTVMRVPLGGGTAEIVAQGQDKPSHIAVDSTGIYWTNEGTGNANGSVMKATAIGCTPITLASKQGRPTGIALSSIGVHWTNDGDPTLKNATVMTLAK